MRVSILWSRIWAPAYNNDENVEAFIIFDHTCIDGKLVYVSTKTAPEKDVFLRLQHKNKGLVAV